MLFGVQGFVMTPGVQVRWFLLGNSSVRVLGHILEDSSERDVYLAMCGILTVLAVISSWGLSRTPTDFSRHAFAVLPSRLILLSSNCAHSHHV